MQPSFQPPPYRPPLTANQPISTTPSQTFPSHHQNPSVQTTPRPYPPPSAAAPLPLNTLQPPHPANQPFQRPPSSQPPPALHRTTTNGTSPAYPSQSTLPAGQPLPAPLSSFPFVPTHSFGTAAVNEATNMHHPAHATHATHRLTTIPSQPNHTNPNMASYPNQQRDEHLAYAANQHRTNQPLQAVPTMQTFPPQPQPPTTNMLPPPPPPFHTVPHQTDTNPSSRMLGNQNYQTSTVIPPSVKKGRVYPSQQPIQPPMQQQLQHQMQQQPGQPQMATAWDPSAASPLTPESSYPLMQPNNSIHMQQSNVIQPLVPPGMPNALQQSQRQGLAQPGFGSPLNWHSFHWRALFLSLSCSLALAKTTDTLLAATHSNTFINQIPPQPFEDSNVHLLASPPLDNIIKSAPLPLLRPDVSRISASFPLIAHAMLVTLLSLTSPLLLGWKLCSVTVVPSPYTTCSPLCNERPVTNCHRHPHYKQRVRSRLA